MRFHAAGASLSGFPSPTVVRSNVFGDFCLGYTRPGVHELFVYFLVDYTFSLVFLDELFRACGLLDALPGLVTLLRTVFATFSWTV